MSIFPLTKHGFLPLIIVAVGVALAALAFSITRDDAERLAVEKFDDAADTVGLTVTSAIKSHVEAVLSIQDLYRASEFVTRYEFAQFISRSLEFNPGVQALEWIPRVTQADRARVEAEVQDIGFPNFTITERNSEGQLVPAGERDEYFPVYYVEPFEGNEAAFGFDLASNPTRLAALNKARDTGEMIASGRIMLVQETGDQFGLLVFAPVYANGVYPSNTEDRRNSLTGFVLGVFRVGDVITTALTHEEIFEDNTHTLDIGLFDLSAPAGSQLLYSSAMGPDGNNEVLPANIRGDSSVAERFGLLELADPDNRTDYFFFDYGFRSYVLRVSVSDTTFATNYRTPVISALAVIILSIVTAIAVSTTRARFRVRNEFVFELNRLIETAGVPILGMEGTNEVNLWNTNIAELTGIPKDSAIGMLNMVDIIVPEDVEMARKVVRSVYETGEPVVGIEVGVKSISGTERRVVFSCTPRYGLDGELSGVFVIGQDITERVVATVELQRVNDDLARLIQTANAPIFGVDQDGNINEWNVNIAEITGYSRDDIFGKNFVSTLISAENQSQVAEVIDAALGGEQTANYESPVRTRDGRTIQILLNASSRRDDAGNIVGVIGVGQDITERVETADERNRLLTEKADLVRRLLESQEEERGVIAYDLHDGPAQHLSGASMFLESYAAIKDEIDSAERDSMISTAKGYVSSALEEIQRIMAGLRPSALDDLGLVQGLRESVREVSRRTGRQVEFLSELDENIEIDETTEIVLYRISQEAVNNAVKHAGTGSISVELSDNDGALVLEIRDHGAGFDVDAVMRSPEYGGMGLLGMQERAGLIGADLSVDSTNGEGTIVTIRLPDFRKFEADNE